MRGRVFDPILFQIENKSKSKINIKTEDRRMQHNTFHILQRWSLDRYRRQGPTTTNYERALPVSLGFAT